MSKESRVVTNVGTIDFDQADFVMDCNITLFARMHNIPEDVMGKVHEAIEDAIKVYSIKYKKAMEKYHQKWGEVTEEVSLEIRLDEKHKPEYSLSIYFEDNKDPDLTEFAYISVDLTAYQEEMKKLIANIIIDKLMKS